MWDGTGFEELKNGTVKGEYLELCYGDWDRSCESRERIRFEERIVLDDFNC